MKQIEEVLICGSIQFRDYQKRIINDGFKILNEHGFLYLAMEVRTGKTLTSLGIAIKTKSKNVLFITKKKAISSIQNDYNMLSCPFDIQIINYESLHLVADDEHWDLIICDEAHSCFIGSTTVDGINIKDIKLGDYLNSFNFATNKYELKKVVNIYKNELLENLVKIKCNGKEIICTESHKIFTKRGWVEARHITSEDELQIL
jgi:type I site-specific restriction endonuclease